VNVFEPNPVYIQRMSGSAMSCSKAFRLYPAILLSRYTNP